MHSRILNRRRLVAERISGQSVLELGHRSNISGMQLRDWNRRLPLHAGDVGEFFLRSAAEVLQRGFILKHARKDFEIRNSPGKRVRHRLEHIERDGLRLRLMPTWMLAMPPG